MVQIRSRLDVADNTGARMATMIGVIGKATLYARIGDVITANVKEASATGTVKKGDNVEVVSGNFRGSSGKILQVLPKKQRVLIEGVRIIKKHLRKSQDNPTGKIAEREGPIHISNVRLIEKEEKKDKKKEAKTKKEKAKS